MTLNFLAVIKFTIRVVRDSDRFKNNIHRKAAPVPSSGATPVPFSEATGQAG